MINKNLYKAVCPRCERCEDWKHIILSNGINRLNDEYVNDLNQSLKKYSTNETERKLVDMIIVDI